MSLFGEIPGYPEGSGVANRKAVREAGLHRHNIKEISGTATDGVDAIVLSGGYVDDTDDGNVLVHTGRGRWR